MADYVLIPVWYKGKIVAHSKVDADDAVHTDRHVWKLDRDGYAVARVDGKYQGMHRFLNGTPDGLMTDHINRDKLDNRKANLRSVTNSVNQANRGPKLMASKYCGVVKDEQGYIARIMHGGKRIHLGRYRTEREAAWAYNLASLRLYGGDGYLNDID